MITDKIKEMKQYHHNQMVMYSDSIRDYLVKYGEKHCDYLTHRYQMSSYHLGAFNALNELERSMKL